MQSRRAFVSQVGGFLVAVPAGKLLAHVPLRGSRSITIYKSSTCGCCTKWVDHLVANGFETTVHDEEAMDRVKDELGVPQALRSCHTAVADRYLVEGHVPASDIQRLLKERPEIMGLAVPGMPAGSPGMAEPASAVGGFTVVAFQRDGATETFARY